MNRLQFVLVCALALALGFERDGAASDRGAARAPVVAAPRVEGQWIWSERDRQLWASVRATRPGFEAAVFTGTIGCFGRELSTMRAHSPKIEGGDPLALVVRLEDSVHGCFDRLDTGELARALDAELSWLLRDARATGARFREIQLDYDAPVAKLARWAEVLRYVRVHSLCDTEVWITSLPVHVATPEYGELFRDAVSGHVLQLFDTGLRCDSERAAKLRAALAARRMPFRLGFGSFERKGASHVCWIGFGRGWQSDPGASGFWIFPAGIDYQKQLALLSGWTP